MAVDKDTKTEEELEKETSQDDEDTGDSQEESTDESESEDSSSKEIDFAAEADAERKRGKPDLTKAQKAFSERKDKRKEDDEESESDDEDKPMSKREAREFLAQETERTFKTANADRILEIARARADSEDEAQYILALHANRIFPSSLTLAEQIDECHAIANRKKLTSTTKELARALKGKQNATKGSTGGHQDALKGPAPKIASDMKASLARAGFIFDTANRDWRKKLPNGKTLVKSSPTANPRIL